MHLLTRYRLVESLNFTFDLVESAQAYIVSFILCYIALYNYPKCEFFIFFIARNYNFSSQQVSFNDQYSKNFNAS